MDLSKAVSISARGMAERTTRLREIAENLTDPATATPEHARPPAGDAVAEGPRMRDSSANLAILEVSHTMLTRAIALLK